jgi:hypothetical protein
VTITLDIGPEVRAELARQATANGRALEWYAARLLEEAARANMQSQQDNGGEGLRHVFEAVSGLADDVDFSRGPATARPVDLS